MKTSRLQSLEVTVGGILWAQGTAWVLTPSVPMCWVCLACPPLGEPPPGQDLLPVSSVCIAGRGRQGRDPSAMVGQACLPTSLPGWAALTGWPGAWHAHLVILEEALEESARVLQQPLARLPVVIHLGARLLPRHLLGLNALHDAHSFYD